MVTKVVILSQMDSFNWVCTFPAVFMCSVEVIDGVHRVELDLRQAFVADPVELRRALAGRRPRHPASS